jgi:beta-lactamase class D
MAGKSVVEFNCVSIKRKFMNKIILSILIILLSLNTKVFADTKCFIIKEKDHILKEEGDCKERHSPCSTFKIAISLMGYDDGILIDELNPEWPSKRGYSDYVEGKKNSQNPTSWIKNSSIWYSQIITTKLGLEKFKSYIAKFNYGNQDISGDKGKDNGLTHSWLASSLKISGLEQVDFLQKLLDGNLPVSSKAQNLTKNIFFIKEMPNGWKLYGRTGTGYLQNADGSYNKEHQIGWFIGWIAKGERQIIFVHYIEDAQKMDLPAGYRAEEKAIEEVMKLINSMT